MTFWLLPFIRANNNRFIVWFVFEFVCFHIFDSWYEFLILENATLMGPRKEAKDSRKICERGVPGNFYFAQPPYTLCTYTLYIKSYSSPLFASSSHRNLSVEFHSATRSYFLGWTAVLITWGEPLVQGHCWSFCVASFFLTFKQQYCPFSLSDVRSAFRFYCSLQRRQHYSRQRRLLCCGNAFLLESTLFPSPYVVDSKFTCKRRDQKALTSPSGTCTACERTRQWMCGQGPSFARCTR